MCIYVLSNSIIYLCNLTVTLCVYALGDIIIYLCNLTVTLCVYALGDIIIYLYSLTVAHQTDKALTVWIQVCEQSERWESCRCQAAGCPG